MVSYLLLPALMLLNIPGVAGRASSALSFVLSMFGNVRLSLVRVSVVIMPALNLSDHVMSAHIPLNCFYGVGRVALFFMSRHILQTFFSQVILYDVGYHQIHIILFHVLP